MSKKQYVIVCEGRRETGRDGGFPDRMLMLDPEEAEYRRDFLQKPMEIVDTVLSYDKVKRHAATESGALYFVTPSHQIHPIRAIRPG